MNLSSVSLLKVAPVVQDLLTISLPLLVNKEKHGSLKVAQISIYLMSPSNSLENLKIIRSMPK